MPWYSMIIMSKSIGSNNIKRKEITKFLKNLDSKNLSDFFTIYIFRCFDVLKICDLLSVWSVFWALGPKNSFSLWSNLYSDHHHNRHRHRHRLVSSPSLFCLLVSRPRIVVSMAFSLQADTPSIEIDISRSWLPRDYYLYKISRLNT